MRPSIAVYFQYSLLKAPTESHLFTLLYYSFLEPTSILLRLDSGLILKRYESGKLLFLDSFLESYYRFKLLFHEAKEVGNIICETLMNCLNFTFLTNASTILLRSESGIPDESGTYNALNFRIPMMACMNRRSQSITILPSKARRYFPFALLTRFLNYQCMKTLIKPFSGET